MPSDHRFALLVHGRQEVVVIMDWRQVCWKAEPVYLDPWASVAYFTAPEAPEPWTFPEEVVEAPQQATLF
jgi:hypothetical protein